MALLVSCIGPYYPRTLHDVIAQGFCPAISGSADDVMKMSEGSVWPVSGKRVGVADVYPEPLPDANGNIAPRERALLVVMNEITSDAAPSHSRSTYPQYIVGEGSVITIEGDRYCVLGIDHGRKRNTNGTVWLGKVSTHPIVWNRDRACGESSDSPEDAVVRTGATAATCISQRFVELEVVYDERPYDGSKSRIPAWVAGVVITDPATGLSTDINVRESDALAIGSDRYSVVELVPGARGRLRLHRTPAAGP